MEELARQCNKFSLLEKQVIYVSGLYEHKLPFTRKAFDSARMESEGIKIEAGEGRSENVQVNKETEGVLIINKGISHVNDETVMRETLHSDSAIPANQDSTSSQLSPAEIQESMNTGYNEWVTRKAFHAARMASEVTGEEAVDGGPERVQVSMETKGTEQLM